MTDRPLRVAVVGAGPAGLYAAGHLLAGPGGTYLDGRIVDLHLGEVEVDVFERLPTPWGLVRGGVAPDHPEKKLVSTVFDAIAARRGFRFFGNVEVGRDLSHQQLSDWYDAVIYAIGAAGDARVGLPGEHLPGSHSAQEFVGWYNGHPDYADLQFDLSTERAIVVGNGNVALDIARILSLPRAVLQKTDMADHAIAALSASDLREVVVLGRRGLAHAAFHNPELEELTHVEHVDLLVEGDDLAAVGTEDHEFARKLATLRKHATDRPGKESKRIVLRFLTSPVELLGRERVEGVIVARNELVTGDDRVVRARATGELSTLAAGLVLRAVGYRGQQVEGVPFDGQRGVIPNVNGRVAGVSGTYVTGWIKRGPSGIIGTNKKCARDTVRVLLADHAAGLLDGATTLDAEVVLTELQERQPRLVTQSQWRVIDRHERRSGVPTGRPRVKLTERSTMLQLSTHISTREGCG